MVVNSIDLLENVPPRTENEVSIDIRSTHTVPWHGSVRFCTPNITQFTHGSYRQKSKVARLDPNYLKESLPQAMNLLINKETLLQSIILTMFKKGYCHFKNAENCWSRSTHACSRILYPLLHPNAGLAHSHKVQTLVGSLRIIPLNATHSYCSRTMMGFHTEQ